MPKKIVLIAINNFTLRFVSETPILETLTNNHDLDIALVTPSEKHQAYIELLGSPSNLHWHSFDRPTDDFTQYHYPQWHRMLGWLHNLLNRTIFKNRAKFENLYFRFSEIHQFVRFLHRKQLPAQERARQAKRARYLEPEYGFPFPKSKFIYQFLYRVYHFLYQHPDLYVESFFDAYQPDSVIFIHVQNKQIKPYWLAAARRKIPTLGIIASWDQPTLSGPLPPNIERYIMPNKMMIEHLALYHNLSKEKMQYVGWPQHDFYKNPASQIPRDQFLKDTFNLSLDRSYILWASYPDYWVAYEPSVLAHLIQNLNNGMYGENITLIIRPHPIDAGAARLKQWEQHPQVIVEDPDPGNLVHLYNLLRHAALLIAPTSTITLDAAAVDTPVININFDGDATPDYYDSSQRWYESEHYSEVVKSGGVTLVDSYESLDTAIQEYLDNPDFNSEGRKRMTDYLVAPSDGLAYQRVVQAILDLVNKT